MNRFIYEKDKKKQFLDKKGPKQHGEDTHLPCRDIHGGCASCSDAALCAELLLLAAQLLQIGKPHGRFGRPPFFPRPPFY